jgi:all-trans-retinol 13,14-reductase
MNNFDVIIIGSGLGGLLCGYILSREGRHVCILEKNHQPGGLLRSFQLKGVEFDTGVHYIGALGEGQVLNRYFRYFGLNDNVTFQKLDENGFDIIGFEDAEYPLAMGFDNFREQLLPFFPSEATALQTYTDSLQEISRAFPLYNLEIPHEHKEDRYYGMSAYRFFHSFASEVSAKTTRQHTLSDILAGNNFLYAGNPFKTPLHVAALINHSFLSGAWRAVGGSRRIAEHLERRIIRAGGEIFTDRKVCRISMMNNVFSVDTTQGEKYTARSLVSAIHPAQTLAMTDPSLLRKAYVNRIMSLKNTSSCFAVFIKLKENSFPLMNYNYYFHNQKNVWAEHPGKSWPGNYMLYTPSFSGGEKFAKSMVIMTGMNFDAVSKWENAPGSFRGPDYLDFKEQRTEALLNLVEKKFTGLRAKIEFMESSTPLTWRDHSGIPEGSMYGIQKDFNDPVRTNVLPKTKIPNMYFTGQNINLHGVLGVTIGSVLACGEMLGLEWLIKKIRNA